MNAQLIKIRLQSYDHVSVEKATSAICLAAVRTGATISGPVPIPNKEKIFTVIRGPHVDKEAQEQFAITVHTRVLIITPSSQTVEALMKLELPAGVEVKIQLVEAA